MHYADQVGLFNVVAGDEALRAEPARRRELLAAGAAARRSWRPKARRSAEPARALVIKRILLALLLALVVALAVVVARQHLAHAVAPAGGAGGAAGSRSTRQAAAERLAGAIRSSTVVQPRRPGSQRRASSASCTPTWQQQFPKAARRRCKQRSRRRATALLYTWTGSDPAAKPIALMAHQDVVPIAPGTEKAWEVDPFARRDQGRLRLGPRRLGRQGQPAGADGSRRDAASASGFQPRQTIYLVFGRRRGSQRPARRHADRRAAASRAACSSTGCSTKACWSPKACCPGLRQAGGADRPRREGLRHLLPARSTRAPGHSSMPPPRHSAIGSMSAALARLEAKPMPAGIQRRGGRDVRRRWRPR